MELFRIIKSDGFRAMRFCGGRAVASVMIIALAYLAVSLTESVLFIIFCGSAAFYQDILTLSKFYNEAIYITAGAAFFHLLTLPALMIGYTKLLLSFAEGKDESIAQLFDMFSSFKKFFGSAVFAVAFCVRHIFVFAAALLPGGAFFWFAKTYIPGGNRTLELLKISAGCIAVAIMILCTFLAFIFVQRWSLAVYYRALGNGIHKSFSLSAKAAKGLHTNIISFKFSFIGWGVLSLLVLPLIWTVPYYGISNAIFAKYLMERYEHSLAQVPETSESQITFTETD